MILDNVISYIPKLTNMDHENNGIYLFVGRKQIQCDIAIDEYLELIASDNGFHQNVINTNAYEDSVYDAYELSHQVACFSSLVSSDLDMRDIVKQLYKKTQRDDFSARLKLLVIIDDSLSYIDGYGISTGFVVKFLLFNDSVKAYLGNVSHINDVTDKLTALFDMSMQERETLGVVANAGRVQFAQLAQNIMKDS